MKLQDYMTQHDGEYHLAENLRPLTPDQLDQELANEEIEVYVVGQDPDGRCTIHLYGQLHHRHIVTHITEPELASAHCGSRL